MNDVLQSSVRQVSAFAPAAPVATATPQPLSSGPAARQPQRGTKPAEAVPIAESAPLFSTEQLPVTTGG